MKTLLPPNSTAQERILAETIDYPLETSLMRGFKFNPNTSVLPWLVWEYGISEVLTWVPDVKRAIQDGINFQRLRGTPESLRIALSWVNLNNVVIEEEAVGVHFAEFQIGIEGILEDSLISSVIALSQRAVPARSRLIRIFNKQYDIRRFILGQSQWGDLLSDYSGVKLKSYKPKLSFGRITPLGLVALEPVVIFNCFRNSTQQILSNSSYKLDFAILSDDYPKFFHQPCIAYEPEFHITSKYQEVLTWHQHRHLNRSWTDSSVIVNIAN